jgi:hypothetical protein
MRSCRDASDMLSMSIPIDRTRHGHLNIANRGHQRVVLLWESASFLAYTVGPVAVFRQLEQILSDQRPTRGVSLVMRVIY